MGYFHLEEPFLVYNKKMFSFCVLFLFFTQFAVHIADEEKAFRVDYQYIEVLKSYYKIHTLPRTWTQAKATCEQEGAVLFYPDDESEAVDVIVHWNKTQPFLHWIHVNLTKKDFLNTKEKQVLGWGKGEPNNSGGEEECLVLKCDGTLNDVNCNSQHSFICKTTATADWNAICHVPDLSYKFSFNTGRCYKFHATPATWLEAYAICSREQSYLAVVDDDTEAAYLINLINNPDKTGSSTNASRADKVHLGFFNRDGWITRTGVPLHETGYCKWDRSQPDGLMYEECGAMGYDGLLHDISCYTKAAFICEHEQSLVSINEKGDNSENVEYRYTKTIS